MKGRLLGSKTVRTVGKDVVLVIVTCFCIHICLQRPSVSFGYNSLKCRVEKEST